MVKLALEEGIGRTSRTDRSAEGWVLGVELRLVKVQKNSSEVTNLWGIEDMPRALGLHQAFEEAQETQVNTGRGPQQATEALGKALHHGDRGVPGMVAGDGAMVGVRGDGVLGHGNNRACSGEGLKWNGWHCSQRWR